MFIKNMLVKLCKNVVFVEHFIIVTDFVVCLIILIHLVIKYLRLKNSYCNKKKCFIL